MADVWIGAGGWGYFRGPTGRSLEDYARAFRFVEVNTTFYRHPSIPAARRWRRTVPGDFRFSVKAHRDVTHTERMRATRRAIAALTRTVAVADALKADLLVLQTPPDLVLGGKEAAALKDLAAGMAGGGPAAPPGRGPRMVSAFQGVGMYKAAPRSLSLERRGSPPPAPRRVGIDAVQEVLAPD